MNRRYIYRKKLAISKILGYIYIGLLQIKKHESFPKMNYFGRSNSRNWVWIVDNLFVKSIFSGSMTPG